MIFSFKKKKIFVNLFFFTVLPKRELDALSNTAYNFFCFILAF